MKTEALKGYLVNLYKAMGLGEPVLSSVLLLGPPGIGKSTAVLETAKEIAANSGKKFIDYDDSAAREILKDPEDYFLYVDFNLNDTEPSDLTGIPKETEIGMSYQPFLWARCLSKASGILFLDEFTNVQRLDVITASYKIVLDHRAGFTKFSDKVMVVAAGNSPEESSVANLLPSPLVGRFIVYKVELPTLEGWADWMDRNFENWDKRVLAYLMNFPDEFLKPPPESETLTNFPAPRSWTKVARLILEIPQGFLKETIIGFLGPETGEKFSAFLEMRVPQIEELLRRPQIFKELDLEGKYLASVFLGSYLQKTMQESIKESLKKDEKIEEAIPLIRAIAKEKTEKVMPLIRVMMEEQKDFVVLSVISAGNRKQEISLALSEKEEAIKKVLKKIAPLRMELEG